MAKSYEELQQQADIIKNELSEGKNTAKRVGAMFKDTLEYAMVHGGLPTGLVVMDYKGSPANTRLSVEKDGRKKGIVLSYNPGQGFILEQYIGNSTADAEWSKGSNWRPLAFDETMQNIAEYARTQGEYAEEYAELARTQGEYANEQANAAKKAAESVKESVTDTLPIGTMLLSASGNIFGQKWMPTIGIVIVGQLRKVKLNYTKINIGKVCCNSTDNVKPAVLWIDGAYYYSDDKELWKRANNGSSEEVHEIRQFYNGDYFSATRQGVIVSEDGKTWSDFKTSEAQHLAAGSIYMGALTYNLASSYFGFLKTISRDTWTSEDTPLLRGERYERGMLDLVGGDGIGDLFVAIYKNKVAATKIMGQNNEWVEKTPYTDVPEDSVKQCNIYRNDRDKLYIVTATINNSGFRLYKSSDLEVWEDMTENLPKRPANYPVCFCHDGVFYMVDEEVMYFSSDMETWNARHLDITGTVLDIGVDKEHVVIVTSDGYVCYMPKAIVSPVVEYGYMKYE